MSFFTETLGDALLKQEVNVKQITNKISNFFFIFINFLIIHSTLLYKAANIIKKFNKKTIS